MLKEPKQTFFSKEDIQINFRYIRKCSAPLIIREMQLQTAMRYRLTPIRMTIIKKTRDNKCWQGYKEKKTLEICC